MPELIEESAPAALIALRGDAADAAFVGGVSRVFGLAPPTQPNRFVSLGERHLVWLGPDDWLAVDRGEGADGGQWERTFGDTLSGADAAICDVSGNRVSFRLAGPRAMPLLSRGCSLDLAAMPPGGSAQTLLARSQVLLLRHAENSFEIMPRRSFAGYVRTWLDAAVARL